MLDKKKEEEERVGNGAAGGTKLKNMLAAVRAFVRYVYYFFHLLTVNRDWCDMFVFFFKNLRIGGRNIDGGLYPVVPGSVPYGAIITTMLYLDTTMYSFCALLYRCEQQPSNLPCDISLVIAPPAIGHSIQKPSRRNSFFYLLKAATYCGSCGVCNT